MHKPTNGPQRMVLAARPRLAPDATVHPPRGDEPVWILERDGRRYFRVGRDMARLAELLTGTYDLDELQEALGPRWSKQTLEAAINQLAGMGLLDDGHRRTFSRRRLQVVPPMSVQFSVLDPSRILARARALIRAMSGRPALVIGTLVVFGGLAGLAISGADVYRLVSSPLPASTLGWVALGAFLCTAVHELSHGAALTHYGARPRRLGVMLFYLFPAFFCDVSDGWLLPDRMQRVRVALAGIAAQLVCAGAAGIAGALLPVAGLRDCLLVLAAVTYLTAMVNLLPFIKLDGYLALMAYTDTSNLRGRAMAEARGALAAALYGARRDRTLPQRWAVPYGLVCLVFPVLLLALVVYPLWQGIVVGTGTVGSLVLLALLLGLVVSAGAGIVRLHRRARQAGARLVRMILTDVVVVAVLVTVLTAVRVPITAAAYYRAGPGGPELLVPASTAEPLAPGSVVRLRSNGLLVKVVQAEATISGGPRPETVAAVDLMPVALDLGTSTEFDRYPLQVTVPDGNLTQGSATVAVGSGSVWKWLATRYVFPAIGAW